MFDFLKRKKRNPVPEILGDWSFLGVDMHGHFIPDLDDGPSDIEDSLSLLKTMQDHGYRKLYTTPHISLDYYPNTESQIASALKRLKEEAKRAGLSIEIEAAAEYMIDESFMAKLAAKSSFLTFGENFVLIEMGFVQRSPALMQAIFELQTLGYQPVLAHPERYTYFQDMHRSDFEAIKGAGCLFQLNTIAFSGYYGKPVKMLAEKLLNEALYDFAGSDVHHARHIHALNSILYTSYFNELKEYPFLNKKLQNEVFYSNMYT